MNFKEFWFGDKDKNILGQDKYQPIDTHRRLVEFGWNSCKKEILDIINKYKNEYISEEMIKEIKKL